jgi:hypothetical protein
MSAAFACGAKRTNRLKLVFWEGSDVCLRTKPLAGVETRWTVAISAGATFGVVQRNRLASHQQLAIGAGDMSQRPQASPP